MVYSPPYSEASWSAGKDQEAAGIKCQTVLLEAKGIHLPVCRSLTCLEVFKKVFLQGLGLVTSEVPGVLRAAET